MGSVLSFGHYGSLLITTTVRMFERFEAGGRFLQKDGPSGAHRSENKKATDQHEPDFLVQLLLVGQQDTASGPVLPVVSPFG